MNNAYSSVRIGNANTGIVELAGFEIPQSLPFGGDQRLVVNQFIGLNKREVQLLGAQPRKLEWRGIFLYESAIDRARFFDNIRLTGELILVQWGDFSFNAIIENFHFDPVNRFHIPYEIGLQVINQDLLDFTFQTVPSRDTIQEGILGTVSTLQSLVAILLKVSAAVDAARRGDINGIATAVTSLASALGSAATLAKADPATISNYVFQATAIAADAKALANNLEILDTSNPLSEALAVSSSATILAGLLAKFIEPAFVGGTSLVRGNLFQIAQDYYGDYNSWSQIADFNNLDDASLLGPQTVQLPPIKGKVPTQKIGSAGTVFETNVVPIPPAESGKDG